MPTFPLLKEKRTRAGLSQNQLARKAGVSSDLVSKAERGGTCMGDKLNAILNALNAHHFNEAGHTLDPAKEILPDPKENNG